MRIIYDITEFNDWHGHLTGIQRLVYSTGKALNELDDVHFCRYSITDNYFVSAALPDLNTEDSILVEVDTTLSLKHRLRSVAMKSYFKLPNKVRRKITAKHRQQAKNVAKKLYHHAQKFKSIGARHSIIVSSTEKFVFLKSDVLIVPGRAWDDKDYLNHIETIKRLTGCKVYFVVYDLIPIFQQHTFGPGLTERYTDYLVKVIKIADGILPISKSSELDLKRFADEVGFLELPSTHVIRLGDAIIPLSDGARPNSIPDKLASQNFALIVGTVEARKNHQILYNVYKLAAEKKIDLPYLAIVGKGGWLTTEFIYFCQNDTDIKNKFIFIDNLDDDGLDWLYKNALLSLYPSQYEGWGLPIAESLAYGLPCIASYTSSMKEIASTKIINYTSPFDSSEILSNMQILLDPNKNKLQRNIIKSNYKPTSWTDTAKQIRRAIAP